MAPQEPPADSPLPYIAAFLGEARCGHHRPTFERFGISTPSQVAYLDSDILLAMGIGSLADRLRILRAASQLQRQQQQLQLDKLIGSFHKLCASIHSNTGLAKNTHLLHRSANSTEDLVLAEKHHAIFILNDGSAKRVNVSGCFNADSIKKRLLARLNASASASASASANPRHYDVFVVEYTKNVLHLLYDVELVTICHSNDRLERNRLILVAKDQTPSDNAVLTSKKIFTRTLNSSPNNNTPSSPASSNKNNNIDQRDKIRKIFNQRPPSEFISTNLTGYFPETNVKKLERTLRDSYRQSMRLSTIDNHRVISPESNKVGDILLKHSNAVDNALLQSININTSSASRSHPSHSQMHIRNTMARDEYNSNNEEEDYEDDYSDENDDIVSLPTKMVTPTSWLKGARIGSGSFGSVYLGMNAKTGELMAVKQVAIQNPKRSMNDQNISDHNNNNNNNNNNNINTDGNADPKAKLNNINQSQKQINESNIYRKMVESLQHEMNLLKELHHENIVTYYGSSQESNNLNIFLEYVPGGSVSSMLNNYGPFEESLIINFTRQILIGVAYLHKKNIIHRDIKGANILIDIKGNVKITDFGISKKLSPLNRDEQQSNKNDKQERRASLQGSVFWMAPEVVKQTATTNKVDIWSTGCVVVEMYTGRHPFPDYSQMQAIFKIGTNISPEIPQWATPEAHDFLTQTFELDYNKRPGAIELLQHQWLDTHML